FNGNKQEIADALLQVNFQNRNEINYKYCDDKDHIFLNDLIDNTDIRFFEKASFVNTQNDKISSNFLQEFIIAHPERYDIHKVLLDHGLRLGSVACECEYYRGDTLSPIITHILRNQIMILQKINGEM
ncbi:MAG: hypothetical protein LBS99_00460, partial [Clostridiales bacterium]|nr:hypothetical protein [Clostridiales bacterium]